MALRVGVDMDGVLVDLMNPTLNYINSKRRLSFAPFIPADFSKEHITSFDFISFSQATEYLDLPTSFGPETPLIEDAKEGFEWLMAQDVALFIVSSPWLNNPHCEKNKRAWLHEHFPDFPQKNVIFTHRKEFLCLDILIDDRLQTCLAAQESLNINQIYLFDQPWNQKENLPVRVYRSFGWPGVVANLRDHWYEFGSGL